MLPRFAFVLLMVLISPGYAEANAKRCVPHEAFAAEVVTDYLNSWDNVYLFFKQFHQCYDGAIAEGAASKIQYLWTDRWDALKEMIALVNKDATFKEFVWQRISDETFPQDGFSRLVNHASQECPSEAREFCAAVIREAKRLQ